MISYDVIGDYMSDLDDVRKRIEKRKRPLNDHNFKKLYNGMVRLMVMMIVVLGSLIVLKNPELEQKIFNQKYLQQLITFVSQSVLDFLPEFFSSRRRHTRYIGISIYLLKNRSQV